MQQRKRTLLTTTTGATVGVAMALGAFAALPANAAEVEYVTTIAPDADPYEGWHVGTSNGADAYDITDAGLALYGKSQVINGFSKEGRPTDLTDVELSFESADSGVFLQLPVLYTMTTDDGELNDKGETKSGFTTLRPSPENANKRVLDLADKWTTSGAIEGSYKASAEAPLEDLLEALGNNAADDSTGYEVLAYGVFVDNDVDATVQSVTWNGARTEFVENVPELPSTGTPEQKPAAPAPAKDSAALETLLKDNGVTPATQSSAGLPSEPLDPSKSYTAKVDWKNLADGYVDVYIYSTPIFVGTFPVVNGEVQVTLSAEILSKLAAGSHTLVLQGQTSGSVEAVVLAVSKTLAATGSSPVLPMGIAGVLLLAGLTLVVVQRRRSVSAE